MAFTPAQIAAKLAPLIDHQLSRANQTLWANISCGRHHRLNADIRSVDERGVGVFFYSGVEIIPFAKITHITVKPHWHDVELVSDARLAA